MQLFDYIEVFYNERRRHSSVGRMSPKILEDLKPEAAYFTARDGKRGGTIVLDVADAPKIPAVAEPFFLHFNASVSFHPCMTPGDLAKAGLEELGKKYK